MEDDQQFCLRWNNHQSTLISVFDTLLENETLVDCTIAAEGRFLKAHKVVLSACSPYFATLLQEQYDKHPIFILKDVKFQELRAMMDYMYRGEVNISQDQLAALLKAAESLQIKGLSDSRGAAPRQEQQPPRVNVPIGGGNKNSYTLETKRVRIGPGPLDSQDISGSREGSSSPSRRRRKVRRRSIENDVHDNSNSSITPQNQGSNATLSGVSAITAAALASQMTVGGAGSVVSPAAIASAVVGGGHASGTTQQLTTNVPKKTDPIKSNVVDAINTADGGLQTSASGAGGAGSSSAAGAAGVAGSIDDQDAEHIATASAAIAPKEQKPNHKQKSKDNASTISPGEMAIEPKSEYDEEANEESVEDLTMDDEMGMDDLDHNAGTSQGGEGSSQEYAWQHDRSQDGLLLTTQETQQRDPQDLTKKFIQIKSEDELKVPPTITSASSANPRSLLNAKKLILNRNLIPTDTQNGLVNSANNNNNIGANPRKRLSMSDVSDMLFEFYKANVAKAPKNQQQPPLVQPFGRQTSPTSAEQMNEPSSIAAIATNGAACDTASKNLLGDEMMNTNEEDHEAQQTSFHPKLKLNPNLLAASNANDSKALLEPTMTAIPTSVLVSNSPQIDVKPLIHPTTGLVISPNDAAAAAVAAASVIKPVPANGSVNPQAAAIAAALIRDGYHSFQQQIRAQEILKQQNPQRKSASCNLQNESPASHSKILENLLRQQQQREQRSSECENEPENYSENNDGDDEDDSRYNGFDDIHLMENGKSSSVNNSFSALQQAHQNLSASGASGSLNDLMTDDSHKLFLAQAQVLRNLEYSLGGEYGNSNVGSNNSSISPTSIGPDGEPVYECRHCGKKYRWKSTLRRHENVECGGKEPSHQCPYCPYKSKQRGNLGVHVRKHHSNLPQLASKRRSKYSMKYEENSNAGSVCSGATSDDSQSKLVIDCSK